MKTPDDVAEMLRLKACGWGLKRIARQLGCSHHTVSADKSRAFVVRHNAVSRSVQFNDKLVAFAKGFVLAPARRIGRTRRVRRKMASAT